MLMKQHFLSLLLAFICVAATAQQRVRIHLVERPGDHDNEAVYIAGTFNKWNPGEEKYKLLPYRNEAGQSDGSLYIDLNLAPGVYEYKFTRGNWNKVETDANAWNIDNRSIRVGERPVIEPVTIIAWKDDFAMLIAVTPSTASPRVQLMDTAFAMKPLKRTRRITIYLPPGYDTSKKKYPVLYMHDGQNLFDQARANAGEWGVDEALDTLSATTGGCIVVGIDHGGSKRLQEYNPYNFEKTGTGEGKLYAQFLVKTLKPYIDRRYRTLSNKANTFIAGSSMGGLISLYTVLKYPNIFSGAGIFSPAFWTAPGLAADIKKMGRRLRTKLYFYAGDKESTGMVPDMITIYNQVHQVAPSPLLMQIRAGGEHQERWWQREFAGFWRWMKE
jgi:predicted alpha/beta superfamily hydrolase